MVRQGFTVLLDMRLSDSFPNKVLVFSKEQYGQWVEKSEVASLIKSAPSFYRTAEGSNSENREELDSRVSAKKSLFDNRVQTPNKSQRSGVSAINKAALTSGFQQTRKLGSTSGSIFE